MVNEISDNEYEQASASELSENKLRHNFRLGDITWVNQSGSSWWPAQVIDEACVGSKPKKKTEHDCLVRLYGTCQHLYIDPWKSNTEFKMMLKQQNKSAMELFCEVLEKDIYRADLSSDYDEEADNSEGTQTKVTTGKTSSRKTRKQEGLKQCSYKGVKKSATTENLDDSENQDQEVGSTATTGTVQQAKRRRGRKSSSSHDTAEIIDKDSCDNSAESPRGKRQKRVVQSVGRREGLRRSARPTAKEYSDAFGDRTASFTDTDAGEDATEVPMVHETLAPHTEIKAMVRDILFKEIIDREHDAEMAYVDEVINGICSATVDSMTCEATDFTKGGQGIKQNGTGVKGESSNVTQKQRKLDQTTEVTKNDHSNSLKEVIDTPPSREAVMKEPGQLSARQMRQIRIMQSLGLIAPSGSPFGKNTVIAAPRH